MMNSCAIFLATLEDSLEFSKMYSEIFPEKNITLDFVKKVLTDPSHRVFLGRAEDNPVGFLYAYLVENEADIVDFGVFKKFRKQGAGARLLNYFLTILRKQKGQATLEVKTDNVAAIRLYEKCGFQKIGIRTHYYADGQDALVYRWSF